MKRERVIYGGPKIVLIRSEDGRYLSARYAHSPEVVVRETSDGRIVLSESRYGSY